MCLLGFAAIAGCELQSQEAREKVAEQRIATWTAQRGLSKPAAEGIQHVARVGRNGQRRIDSIQDPQKQAEARMAWKRALENAALAYSSGADVTEVRRLVTGPDVSSTSEETK